MAQDTTAASSVTPQSDQLLAYILGKLNSATREKVLRDLPAEFASNGNAMPRVDAALIDASQLMLAKLRRTVSRPRRGAVTGEFDISEIPAVYMSRLAVAG